MPRYQILVKYWVTDANGKSRYEILEIEHCAERLNKDIPIRKTDIKKLAKEYFHWNNKINVDRWSFSDCGVVEFIDN